jgi:hypothetical protein
LPPLLPTHLSSLPASQTQSAAWAGQAKNKKGARLDCHLELSEVVAIKNRKRKNRKRKKPGTDHGFVVLRVAIWGQHRTSSRKNAPMPARLRYSAKANGEYLENFSLARWS